MALLTQIEAALLKNKYDINMHHAALVITDRCNMNCSCCYRNAGSSNKDMTKKEIKKALSFLDDSWCVDITGGEPTLRYDLIKYAVKLAKKKGCKIRLATNGLFLKDLKKIIKLKIDYISIGLNSYHRLHEDIQKVISELEKDSVYTKVFINGILDDEIPYKLHKDMFIIRDLLSKAGREQFGNSYRFHKSSCGCQGIAFYPNRIVAPFCRQGKIACANWKLEDFSKNILNKYFNSENRPYYMHKEYDMRDNYCEFNLIPEDEENDTKEKTNRSKGLPFM